MRSKNKEIKKKKVCDTCDRKIDDDAIFCPYCGIPLDVDGNIRSLQKELRGEGAVDVLDLYKKADEKRGIKPKRSGDLRISVVATFSIIFLMLVITFTTFVLPIIKQKIADYRLKKELESAAIYDEMQNDELSNNKIVETSQPVIELKDTWIKRDGFFYAFDKNGDPVVDDWVTETDENGEEQKYYFDIDGKLVVNSWIDGEYYVGSDGAMLKDQETPDGAYVDEDGRVLLQMGEGVEVTRETYVYYEHPNDTETIAASNMKSNISGEIKGVDPEKKYELYVKKLRQERETVIKGDLKCNITYYVPIMDGSDEREVTRINAELESTFVLFKEAIVRMANESRELPKSIIFNTIEQRTLTSNRINILAHGKVLPRKGLTEKKKIRFVYDRKSKKIEVRDITE